MFARKSTASKETLTIHNGDVVQINRHYRQGKFSQLETIDYKVSINTGKRIFGNPGDSSVMQLQTPSIGLSANIAQADVIKRLYSVDVADDNTARIPQMLKWRMGSFRNKSVETWTIALVGKAGEGKYRGVHFTGDMR